MVGILVSFWDGLFSGDMLVSGRARYRWIFHMETNSILKTTQFLPGSQARPFGKIVPWELWETKPRTLKKGVGIPGRKYHWLQTSRFLFKQFFGLPSLKLTFSRLKVDSVGRRSRFLLGFGLFSGAKILVSVRAIVFSPLDFATAPSLSPHGRRQYPRVSWTSESPASTESWEMPGLIASQYPLLNEA